MNYWKILGISIWYFTSYVMKYTLKLVLIVAGEFDLFYVLNVWGKDC